jgi:predicted  nucleic acid-binding Zn-ribbon protein
VNQEVERLWELQSVLTQIADREKQLGAKPESFAAVDRELETANEEVGKLTASLETLSKERRRVEGELSDQQELLKKYQGQLMQVKNQQQYAAAWKEIDATRKHVKELEDSALKTIGEIDGLQAQLDERQAGHDALKTRWETAHGAWQHSLSDLRGEVEALKGKVAFIEQNIPDAIKREFYRIFRQRQGVAMAPVISDSCSSCRSRIRPALQQQLKRGELVYCEGCHRILYVEKPVS